MLLIWWLVTSSRPVPINESDVTQLIAIAVAPEPAPTPGPPAPPAPPPPAPPQPEPPVELPQLPTLDPLPAPAAQASDSSAVGGGGCALAITIGRAIEADPEAMRALVALTPDLRTAADAVMLWNGDWSRAAIYPGGVIAEPLRQLVLREIAAAPVECRESGVIGLQLIPVADRGRTAMLAVGSGVWRWADLLLERPPPPAAPISGLKP